MQRQNMRNHLQVSSAQAAGRPAVGQTHCMDDGSILRGCAQLPPRCAYFPRRRPIFWSRSALLPVHVRLLGALASAAKARGRPTCGRG